MTLNNTIYFTRAFAILTRSHQIHDNVFYWSTLITSTWASITADQTTSSKEAVCDGLRKAHTGNTENIIAIDLVGIHCAAYVSAIRRCLADSLRLITTAAIGAAALYYTTSPSSTPANNSSASTSSAPSPSKPTSANPSSHASESKPGHRHEAEYASDVPKPVEDRHGDTVNKHSIAAHKNQNKLRVGKFSGKEFDNHELEHTPGKPGGDFEKKK